jgi:uncharacterized membrane protein
MIWIVTLCLFFYLIYRINHLEEKLSKLQIKETKKNLEDLAEIHTGYKPVSPASAKEQPKPLVAATPAILSEKEVHEMRQPLISDKNWEADLGGKVFTVVGAIAVLFGLGFFLKYAFDHNLINELGRTILGLTLGAIFVFLGQFTKKKYPLYGKLLVGLGLGIFYLSIYASFNLYHLVSQPVAFIGMILATALGIALAIQNDSEAMAGLAQLGGLITPLLLANGQNNPHTLFGYLIFLNAGILILSFLKPWQTLNFTGLLGTTLLYALWFGTSYKDQFTIGFAYATIFFLMFFAANLTQYYRRKIADEKTLLILNFNTFSYFGFTYLLMNHVHHAWIAPFGFILGSVYLLLSFVTYSENQEDFYSNFLLGLGFILYFIVVPIQFHKFVISISWAAEALVLVFLGFKMQTQRIRYLAHGFFIIAVFYTLAIGNIHQANHWVNNRMFTTVFVAAAMITASYIYWLKKSATDSLQTNGAFAPSNEFTLAITALGLESYLLIVYAASLEIYDFGQRFWWPIIWAIAAFVLGVIGIRIKNFAFRFITYATLGIVGLRLVVSESVVNLRAYTPFLNTRVFAYLSVFITIQFP